MAEPLFREYEAIVLEYLLEPILPDEVVDDIIENSTFVSLEVTGAGYFLTVRHPWIGSRRVVSTRNATGEHGELRFGFVVFLEDGELTLECFTYVDEAPPSLRDLDIEIYE